MTHGSKSKRQHGSIGMSATPSRVLPGLKMAGHMGAERVKIRKLKVSGRSNMSTVQHSPLLTVVLKEQLVMRQRYEPKSARIAITSIT